MNPSQVEALFTLPLKKPAGKRPAFLDAMCDGDPALRQLRDQTAVDPSTSAMTNGASAQPVFTGTFGLEPLLLIMGGNVSLLAAA